MPWTGPENGPRYYDLKSHPEFLAGLEEVRRVPELGEFLAALNSPSSIVATAKCDVWSSTEISPEEEIYGASHKFGSYVDLILPERSGWFSITEHEQFARRVTELLKKAPDLPASAEFLIRRCYYHEDSQTRDGCYITFYLFGYGEHESRARQRWAIALKLVENAIKQALLEEFA
ncbi:MAG TPA: hypothetical protein VFB28_11515 [Terriglobales bacterium]|nr:hypothetical protein [Terriglobales bacterium]